jgi:23S rRNA (cytidine2498-2'-O)-methyltransferase
MEEQALDFNPAEIQSVYLAPEGMEQLVAANVTQVVAVRDRLVLSAAEPIINPWAQNIWYAPKVASIISIKDAASTLKSVQRNWWPYSFQLHRRTSLIQEALPKVSSAPLKFPATLSKDPLGSFTLLDSKTMLYSDRCSSQVPNGEYTFEEDRVGPPNRAYLKVWEALTRAGCWPGKEDVCLELGASPGGWTYVLAGLARKVVAIDRSPLDAKLQKFKNIDFQTGNAFAALPAKFPDVTWVFSDVICYPEKLYDFVNAWIEQAPLSKMICTIKFQGSEHYHWASRFAALPGSSVVHLHHNKNELTWFRV